MPYAIRGRQFVLGLLLLALAVPLRADEPSAEKPAGPDAAERLVDPADPKDPSDEAATPLREQTIYVPYDKLRETFEKTGRGVFIPYDRFQELWQAARLQQDKMRQMPRRQCPR